MNIPSAKEMRVVTENVKNSERVEFYLDKIIRQIQAEAKRGNSRVIIEDLTLQKIDVDIPLNIACQKLLEKGFTVENYTGTKREVTCFGAGRVQVSGLKVSW